MHAIHAREFFNKLRRGEHGIGNILCHASHNLDFARGIHSRPIWHHGPLGPCAKPSACRRGECLRFGIENEGHTLAGENALACEKCAEFGGEFGEEAAIARETDRRFAIDGFEGRSGGREILDE